MTIVHQNKPAQESLSDTAKYIYEFYRRDDISSVNPGRKEVRTVLNEDDQKVKMAKRVMSFTLREAHQIYKKEVQERGESPVGISKFCYLLPCDVFLA